MIKMLVTKEEAGKVSSLEGTDLEEGCWCYLLHIELDGSIYDTPKGYSGKGPSEVIYFELKDGAVLSTGMQGELMKEVLR